MVHEIRLTMAEVLELAGRRLAEDRLPKGPWDMNMSYMVNVEIGEDGKVMGSQVADVTFRFKEVALA